MTSLKTAQDKGVEILASFFMPEVTGSPEYHRQIEAMYQLAQTYTDLLDSIEKGMGGEKSKGDEDYDRVMGVGDTYNTAHRKFLSVIKEHRT